MMADTAYYALTPVGTASKGAVISFSREQIAAGVDVSRLLALGAILLATDPEVATGVTPLGADSGIVQSFEHSGAPTNGTSGTQAGRAPLGSSLVDMSTRAAACCPVSPHRSTRRL